MGQDVNGATYWYFYGTRLYRQDADPQERALLDSDGEQKAVVEEEKKPEKPDKKKWVIDTTWPMVSILTNSYYMIIELIGWAVCCFCNLTKNLLYPHTPAQRSYLVGIYWFDSVRMSCRPSVRLSHIPCPLCSAYSSGWVLFIFLHLIKQLQKVCRV